MQKSISSFSLGIFFSIKLLSSLSHLDAGTQEVLSPIRYNQSELYLYDSESSTWKNVDFFSAINKTTYICSAAIHPSNPLRIALGTSFEGIYESSDGGKSWKFLSDSKIFKELYQGSGFYNEVSELAYPEAETDDLVFNIGFGGGTWKYLRKNKKIEASSYDFSQSSANRLAPEGFFKNENLPLVQNNNSEEERLARKERASNKTGVYLNPSVASGKKLDSSLAMVKRNGMNSIVVDFKDDEGFLTYASSLDLAQKMKNSKVRINAEELISKAHALDIYVIARIVVFKDRQLYAYDKNAYALWDKTTKKPWGVIREGVQVEYWVDPYSDFVHQYNISLALELEKLGVDEVQFDYIRFPSDGLTKNIEARFHKTADGSISKTEAPRDRIVALSTFLSKAREAIKLPISTDVFGFNAWARMSYLGQDIQAFANYVDVISPMAYPSHYALDFLPNLTYFDRASYIYNEGTKRAISIVEDKVLIRPYVQAFLLGKEREYSDAKIFDYLNRQVRASKIGGANGFTLWNNMGNYYMIDEKNFKSILGE